MSFSSQKQEVSSEELLRAIKQNRKDANEELKEALATLLGALLFIGLFSWAIVSCFGLNWGQALVITWCIEKLSTKGKP
jgi:hypothetical protein